MAYATHRREDVRSNILKQGEIGPAQGIRAGAMAELQWPKPLSMKHQWGGNWTKRTEEDRSKLFCTNCVKKKHTRDTCFELHGYLEWWEERRATKQNQPSSKGRAAAAVAVCEGGAATTAGSNPGVASNRGSGGQQGPMEEVVLGVASVARRGIAETKEAAGEGNLVFGDLSSNPHNFEDDPIIYPKNDPPDLFILQTDSQTSIWTNIQPLKTDKCQNDTQETRNIVFSLILCKNRFQALENMPKSYALSVI